jgi:hypothetical protein
MLEDMFEFDVAFFPCANSRTLLVFLPSRKSEKAKSIVPYYPRISWAQELSAEVNCLYLSDPFALDSDILPYGGSWFIDSKGVLCLPHLSAIFNKMCMDNFDNCIFYGSSMGGCSVRFINSCE